MDPIWNLKVNCLIVEKVYYHLSWRFRAVLRSLKAIAASSLSSLARALSVRSFTRLKSPSIMSGLMFVFSICMQIVFQKSRLDL